MKHKKTFLLTILFLGAIVLGCEKKPQTLSGSGNVSGVVQFRDKPVANVLVKFANSDGVEHTATTDENGHFEMASVSAGPYMVGLTPSNPRDLPPVYGNPPDSGLVFTVVRGNNSADFNLK